MDEIGGYRLVRMLGGGEYATVQLARLDDADDEAAVVIKQFRSGVGTASITTEIEALARAAGPGVVALLDVTTAPDGRLALVLARCSGGELARSLARRGRIPAAEATGLLVAVALALARLHHAGVVHGRVGAEAVLLEADGVPVLAGFGRAHLIEAALPPARLDEDPGVQEDRRALGEFAIGVLSRVDERDLVEPLQDWLAQTPSVDPAELARRSRLACEPMAWNLHATAMADAPAIPARMPVVAPAVTPISRRSLHRPHGTATTPSLAVLTERSPVRAVAASVLASPRVGRAVAGVRAVRMRVWLPAVVILLGLVIAVVAIPGVGAPSSAVPTPAVPIAPSPTGPTAMPPGSDEPVDQAVERLLGLRQRCIDERSVLCLDGVDQEGSPAMSDDRAMILGLADGGELPAPLHVQAPGVEVVERLGDAVLVRLSGVASGLPTGLLLTSGPAGWRVRDYLTE